jgi:streptogramin lyase
MKKYMLILSILFIYVPSGFSQAFSATGSWKVFTNDFNGALFAVTKDYVWVTSISDTSVSRFNKHDKTYTIITKTDNIDGFSNLSRPFLDGEGNIWGTAARYNPVTSSYTGRLVKFDGTSWTVVGTLSDLVDSISQIFYDGDHGLWYTTSMGAALDMIDTRSYQDTFFGRASTYLLNIYRNALLINRSGGGVYTIDREFWIDQETFVNHLIELTAPFDISGMFYTAVGRDNVLWFGCGSPYVQLGRYDGTNWTLFTKDNGYPVSRGSFPQPITMQGLTVDSNGNVWIKGTYTVSRFDGETSETFYNLAGNPLVNENNIGTMIADPENGIWVQVNDVILHYDYASTGISQSGSLPSKLILNACIPNPFNSSTTLSFTLPTPGSTTLSIYSLTGQRIRTLVSDPMSSGTHSVVWDGRDDSGRAVSSGVYLSRLESGGKAATGKMLMMK